MPLDLLQLRVFNMLGPLRIIKKRLYTITQSVGFLNNLHVLYITNTNNKLVTLQYYNKIP